MKNKILIVDDTPELLQSIAFSLKMEGYEVFPFESPADALSAISSNAPDVIITDLTMQPMDGFEFIAEVKKQPDFYTVPIIIFSARPKSENYEKALRLNVTDYISKPVTVEMLLDKIGSIIKEHYGK